MIKKYILSIIFAFSFLGFKVSGQELRIKKGTIIDSLMVNDSINESFALYLPRKFQLNKQWPFLAVFNMEGKGKEALSHIVGVADSLGYVVAASNAVHDSLSISNNILRTKRMFDRVFGLLSIHKARTYTMGTGPGGRFASLVPIFMKDVAGTVSVNAALANIELLNSKNSFHFIGLVDRENFNYPTVLKDEKILNGLKFPNAILVGDASQNNINERLAKALTYFELLGMIRGTVPKDSLRIKRLFEEELEAIEQLKLEDKPLLANRMMAEAMGAYRNLHSTDSLKISKRELKKTKAFRTRKREQDAAFFKEGLLKEDFVYYLEEDVLAYNFNNLGWWNYQMNQIEKFVKSPVLMQQMMGKRLKGFVNALVDDNIGLVKVQKIVDEEALVFLYMLKTLTAPQDFSHYFNVVSLASKNEDYGTALFYLEEALKKGFTDKEGLYAIENTALFRITPEFNALMKKYFKDARYEIIKDE